MDINNFTGNLGELALPSRIQTAFCDKVVTAEVAQDFVLPDYQPEMRKLLRVTPSILPPSRFLGAGEAEFAGGMTFDVLYVGGDGALYSAELSAPYSFRVPMEGDERFLGSEPLQVNAEITPDTVITRVSAPRKLNIKCRLRAHVLGLCDEEVDMTVVGERAGSETLEKLERVRFCGRVVYATGEALELADEMAIPAGDGELRLIGNSGVVQVTEALPVDGGISCRGELYWKAMVTRDRTDESGGMAGTGDAEILVRRIPFTQVVELPMAITGDCEAMAHGICTGITARVEGDRILATATLVLEVQAQGSDKVTFVCDCYSTAREGTCEMRRFDYVRALSCINGNVSESGMVSLTDAGIPQGATPLDISASAIPTGIVCERGRSALNGECHYQLLYRTLEGELGSAEFTLPLRYELPAELCRDADAAVPYNISAQLDLLSARARPENDGFTIDAEWSICARVFAPSSIEAVGEAHFDADRPAPRASYTLCYPSDTESLWTIAKRYHAPLRPLASLNNLPGSSDPASTGSLEGVRFLMIG